MTDTCTTCRFWQMKFIAEMNADWRDKTSSTVIRQGGECRRHAPIYRPDTHSTVWPDVADIHWCGDYQPCTEAQAIERKAARDKWAETHPATP